MKITTIALLGITTLAANTAVSENIGAGRDGWGYDRRAEAFVQQIRGDWQVVNFAGSEDIARAVCEDNDTPLGIMQIDAMVQMKREGCTLQPYPMKRIRQLQ